MDSTFLRQIASLLLLATVSACAPVATPVAPGATATAGDTAQATSAPFIRYAITQELRNWLPASVNQMRVIVEVYDGSTAIDDYDLVAAYGIYEGWQQSPVQHQVALLLNTATAPLDQLSLRDLIIQAVNPAAIISQIDLPGITPVNNANTLSDRQIREQLANAGYPDGIALTGAAVPIPGLQAIITSLGDNSIFINPEITLEQDMKTWFLNTSEHFSIIIIPEALALTAVNQYLIPLYLIPISYRSRDNLPVAFTADGIPLPPGN